MLHVLLLRQVPDENANKNKYEESLPPRNIVTWVVVSFKVEDRCERITDHRTYPVLQDKAEQRERGTKTFYPMYEVGVNSRTRISK